MATIQPLSYSGYRFPALIMSHCTWLYFQVIVSHATAIRWSGTRAWSARQSTGLPLPQNSPGSHVLLDNIGPGPRPIEELRLVPSDPLANAWSGELGHPGEKRSPVGKSLEWSLPMRL